jgi:hypothetical protein
MNIHGKKPLALIIARAVVTGSRRAAPVSWRSRSASSSRARASCARRSKGLPVLTLDRQYIEQSGATNVTEPIQQLPQVQNFVANHRGERQRQQHDRALHALPSKYTLVLIDGVRPPPAALNNSFGGGFGAAIQAIPLDAVERVEILLDGATAVYGSDAVAGVVNFILKKNTTEGNAYAQYTWPTHEEAQRERRHQQGLGRSRQGRLECHGDVHAHQEKLQATDRKFSAGCLLPVHAQRRELYFQQRDREHRAWEPYFPGGTGFELTAAPTPIRSTRTTGKTATARFQPRDHGSDRHGSAWAGRIPPLQLRRDRAGHPVGHPNFVGKGYLKRGDSATAWIRSTCRTSRRPCNMPTGTAFGLNTTTRTRFYNTHPAVSECQ